MESDLIKKNDMIYTMILCNMNHLFPFYLHHLIKRKRKQSETGLLSFPSTHDKKLLSLFLSLN